MIFIFATMLQLLLFQILLYLYPTKQKTMKKIISVILIILLIGCKKETEKTCYYCEFGFSTEPPRTVCLQPWEKLGDIKFVDANNNDLSAFCVKR